MDGDAEGMVAIVQGLKGAGLAVTMMGRKQGTGPSTNNGPSTPLTPIKPSEETCTKGLLATHTGAQICDDMYTSSYQLAHCKVQPSSPSSQMPEYPKQRPDLSRGQGHFEIGRDGYGESYSPPGINVSSRSRATSLDRGASSRETESFIQSLRKYPPGSLERSTRITSELVQRLITYTQAKNFSKGSCHFKSARNLCNKSITEQPKEAEFDKPSKSIQTYTRTRPPVSEESNGKLKKDSRKSKTKRCTATSPVKDMTRYNETFDYLKSSSPRFFSRNAEVRYLNDMTRCLRDTIRQLCDDNSEVCPNIQSRYSRHRRQHHAETVDPQLSTASNNIEAQASVPMVSTGVPVVSPRASVPSTSVEIGSTRRKICCYCGEPIPCACSPKSSSDTSSKTDEYAKKLEQQVHSWLNEIPVFANDKPQDKTTRENLVKDLINKLYRLERNENYEENAKNEILQCVNSLPMWYPTSKHDQDVFKTQVVNNLFDKIRNISSDFDYQDKISELVNDIHFKTRNSKGELADEHSLKQNLIDKLTTLVRTHPSDKSIKSEVVEILNEFPIVTDGDRISYINNLGEKLANKLEKLSKKDVKRVSNVSLVHDIEQCISRWLKDIPKFSAGSRANILEQQKLIESLAQKLQTIRSHGINDKKIKENMQNEIIDWLESNSKTSLDGKTKYKLSEKLLSDLDKILFSTFKKRDDTSINGEIVEKINAPEYRKRWSTEEDVQKKHISKEISRILDNVALNVDNNSKNKIQSEILLLITNNIEKVKSQENQEILAQIIGILEKETPLSTRSANNIAEDILQAVQSVSLELKPRISKELRIKNALKEEITQSLNNTDINIDDRWEIELTISNILADQVMRGESDRKTKDRLLSVLKNANTSNDESLRIATELIGKGKELSLSYKSQDSSSKLADKYNQQNENLMSKATKKILDFTEDITGDTSVHTTRKYKNAAEDLAERIIDILNSHNSPEDERKYLQDEITQYYQELDIQLYSEDLLGDLVNILQNMMPKTSTPRKSFDKYVSFRPLRNSGESTMSSIFDDEMSQQYHRRQPCKEEVEYTAQLIKKIEDWIRNLNMDLNTSDEKFVKDILIKNLAVDIIDRHKYLQLNPNVKTSDEEELEHLNYQVFRWFNKLSNIKKLMPSISQTNELMTLIKAVPIPQLIKDKKLGKSTVNDSSSKPEASLRSLLTEISTWIESVPSNCYSSTDKNFLRDMTEKLAKNINLLQSNESLTETALDNVIREWLQEMLKDKSNMLNLSEGLKAVLINKELITLSDRNSENLFNRLKDVDAQLQKKRHSINSENIYDIIRNWSQNLPFQRGKTFDDISNHIKDFSTSIKKLCENSDVANINDMKTKLQRITHSFMKSLPLEADKMNDCESDLVERLLALIIETSKENKASNVSDRAGTTPGFRKAADVFYDYIVSWLEEELTLEEQDRNFILKQNIVGKLINNIADLNMNPEIFNDDSLYEDLINDKINELLNTLPQSPTLEKNMSTFKNNLLQKILEAKQKARNELAGHAYKQQLKEAISNSLPSLDNISEEQKIPYEIIKDNLADAFINLNYSADSDELKNKYKQHINNEIDKFCNDYLKRFPATPVDPQQLNQKLFTMLQKVPVPKDETIKLQVEQMRIKDEINDWLINLPLSDNSPSAELQKNKIVSVLAKDLHEIEKEKNFNSDVDVEQKMKHDIIKWTKKLPLKSDFEGKMDNFAEKLVDKLKSTENSRRYSISKIGAQNLMDTSGRTLSHRDNLTQYSPPLKETLSQHLPPPSTLSTQDKQYLEKIRQRSKSPCPLMCQIKDASVNPIPVDAVSQTDIRPQVTCPSVCPFTPGQPHNYMPYNQPISPNVIVNEYNWENTDSSIMQRTVCGGNTSQIPHLQGSSCLNINHRQYPCPSQKSQQITGDMPHQYSSTPEPPHSCMQTPCPVRTPSCLPQRASHEIPRSPYTEPQPPCISSQHPCVTSPQSIPQMQSFSSRLPACTSRDNERGSMPRQPAMRIKPSDISNASSPLEEYDANTNSSFLQPHVTKLGSFDDNNPDSKSCGSQSPKPKRSSASPDEDSEWTMRLPDDANSILCSRRRPYRLSIPSVGGKITKERKEEKIRCRCSERILAKNIDRTPENCYRSSCHATDSIQHCPKCCGAHCPHPSYLFFE